MVDLSVVFLWDESLAQRSPCDEPRREMAGGGILPYQRQSFYLIQSAYQVGRHCQTIRRVCRFYQVWQRKDDSSEDGIA